MVVRRDLWPLLFDFQSGDLLAAFAVIVQLAAFVIAAVAQAAGLWAGFTLTVFGEAELYGPGFLINLAGALIGFGLTLKDLSDHGCLG